MKLQIFLLMCITAFNAFPRESAAQSVQQGTPPPNPAAAHGQRQVQNAPPFRLFGEVVDLEEEQDALRKLQLQRLKLIRREFEFPIEVQQNPLVEQDNENRLRNIVYRRLEAELELAENNDQKLFALKSALQDFWQLERTCRIQTAIDNALPCDAVNQIPRLDLHMIEQDMLGIALRIATLDLKSLTEFKPRAPGGLPESKVADEELGPTVKLFRELAGLDQKAAIKRLRSQLRESISSTQAHIAVMTSIDGPDGPPSNDFLRRELKLKLDHLAVDNQQKQKILTSALKVFLQAEQRAKQIAEINQATTPDALNLGNSSIQNDEYRRARQDVLLIRIQLAELGEFPEVEEPERIPAVKVFGKEIDISSVDDRVRQLRLKNLSAIQQEIELSKALLANGNITYQSYAQAFRKQLETELELAENDHQRRAALNTALEIFRDVEKTIKEDLDGNAPLKQWFFSPLDYLYAQEDVLGVLIRKAQLERTSRRRQ